MALSQIYSAIPGDIITAARWNNEFGNIYNNGTDVAFPVTKAVSFGGFTLTLDAASVTTIISSATQAFQLTPGSKTGTPGINGSFLNLSAGTFTDNNTAAAGTATQWNNVTFRTPTLAATNAGVITSAAATVKIEGPPTAGANETITNPYALHVDAGKAQFDGDVQIDGTVIIGTKLLAPVTDPYLLANIRLNVTMNASACTIAVVTDNNTNATSSDPINVRFRNGTLATGGTTKVSITSALSLVISSGSTLGCVSGQPHRLYVGLLNNGGTAELFIYNPLSGANLKGLTESSLLTTTTEGGVGTADSAQTAYSTVGRATKAFRIIGFFECTQATAGTWATAASTVQELQPWMPRTGHIVGSAIATNGVSSTSSTATFTVDDTPSSSAGGLQVISINYTPVNSANVIEIDGQVAGIGTTGDTPPVSVVVPLFTDLSASAIATDIVCATSVSGVAARGSATLKVRSASLGAMTSAQIRAGASNSTGTNTFAFNSFTTVTDEGATMNSYISITEIMT